MGDNSFSYYTLEAIVLESDLRSATNWPQWSLSQITLSFFPHQLGDRTPAAGRVSSCAELNKHKIKSLSNPQQMEASLEALWWGKAATAIFFWFSSPALCYIDSTLLKLTGHKLSMST